MGATSCRCGCGSIRRTRQGLSSCRLAGSALRTPPSVAWGDLAGFGEPPPSPSPKRLGNLPPPGRWSRLDINLKELGITKDTAISELAFVQVDGTAYYDKVSIVSKAVPQGLPPQLLGPRRWTNIEVDLSRFAGKTVWLRVGRVAEAEKKGHELWSKLELGD